MRVGDHLIRRPLDVERQRPPPPPIQLGTAAQAQDNFLQAGIVAARSKGPMKVAVANTPLVTVLPVVIHEGCALQEVMGRHDLRLPPHIPTLDRQAQHHRFNLHARFREADDVFDRKLTHPKATLRCSNDQPRSANTSSTLGTG
jgi:hypothetical protein